jgi:hypothetical protein
MFGTLQQYFPKYVRISQYVIVVVVIIIIIIIIIIIRYLIYAGYLHLTILKQTTSLGITVLPLFCSYYSWCV